MSAVTYLVAALASLPALLTCEEAATAARVDVRTINRWRAAKKLESVKSGATKQARVLIPRDALVALLSRGSHV